MRARRLWPKKQTRCAKRHESRWDKDSIDLFIRWRCECRAGRQLAISRAQDHCQGTGPYGSPGGTQTGRTNISDPISGQTHFRTIPFQDNPISGEIPFQGSGGGLQEQGRHQLVTAQQHGPANLQPSITR
jgi:hypothetical protein